jgi:hypothetical protein
MLDSEFVRQRAKTVRELVEKATDPFIKGRLVNSCDTKLVILPGALTPADLKFKSQGTGSER